MAKSTLDIAENLIKRRKFNIAIRILESSEDTYAGDFEYHLALGIAELYADSPGEAYHNFEEARKVKINDVRLLLGQAVIFLRRGDVSKALTYYLDVLDLDPDNKTANRALEFIKIYGDYTTIRKWIDSGDIKKFYPPLGINPDIIRNSCLIVICICIFCAVLFTVKPWESIGKITDEVNQRFSLTQEEKEHPIQRDILKTDYTIELSSSEVSKAFNAAKRYFGEGRDNAAQRELNRIIYSNAAQSIRAKCFEMESLLKEPTFDSLKDNYSYQDVIQNPVLYQDCYVIWDGTATNENESDGKWSCILLVDYIPGEGKNTITGNTEVVFDSLPSSPVDLGRPVRFLAQIKLEQDGITLSGKGIYQSLKGATLN